MKYSRFSARARVVFFGITYLYLLTYHIIGLSKPVPELIECGISKPVPGLIECGISKPVPELIDFIPVQRRINSPELRLTLGKRIDTDDASNHGGADIKSNFDLQDILLKMDSHSVPFKYEKNVRISYITAHQSVAQGSFVIEPVMVLLTYLTRVQDAMQVRGDIGEIGVHHGKFFVGLGHLQKVNEKL
jgi:hypothetical protein